MSLKNVKLENLILNNIYYFALYREGIWLSQYINRTDERFYFKWMHCPININQNISKKFIRELQAKERPSSTELEWFNTHVYSFYKMNIFSEYQYQILKEFNLL
jgi:hypothetical protein